MSEVKPKITDDSCGYCGADLHKLNGYTRLIGVEYSYNHPGHYDGVSEWMCPDCGTREGRWSGKRLGEGEYEPRFGKAAK